MTTPGEPPRHAAMSAGSGTASQESCGGDTPRGPADRPGAAHLDTTRGNKTEGAPGVVEESGLAVSEECPRKGSVLLRKGVRRVIVNTTCNQWGCKACRDRVSKRFRSIVMHGVWTLGRCAFITVTYKAGVARHVDVACVRKDWQVFWQRLRRHEPWVRKMAWLKVTELTKREVPHHHLILGAIPEDRQVKCWGDVFEVGRYRQRMGTCACLAHSMAREWHAVTGDSYIVHTTGVTSGEGAARYVSKYLEKDFGKARGDRRFSKSRNWPTDPGLKLRGSASGWDSVSFRWGHVEEDLEGGDAYLGERIGSARAVELEEKQKPKRLLRAARGVRNEPEDVRSEDVRGGGERGNG